MERNVSVQTSDGGIRAMLMRGGTSKGLFFVDKDLPQEETERNDLLRRVMGSPDTRQIDGVGGAHPLTSKVAIVSPSEDDRCDVEYLFLQVAVDGSEVSSTQNCGNMLAGVGAFAIERGLVPITGDTTPVCIRMVNSDSFATAHVVTPHGRVRYEGDTELSGVPGTAAAVVLDFTDTAGSATLGLFPTGATVDKVAGRKVTCVDNGMPVVIVDAADLGVTGHEPCDVLEADAVLKSTLEEIRLAAGQLMGMGDVTNETIPKIALVSAPAQGGLISTRMFIPKRCHTSVGVFAAISLATASKIPGTVAYKVAANAGNSPRCRIEHPSGHLDVEVEVDTEATPPAVSRSGVVRTARRIFDGTVYPAPPRIVSAAGGDCSNKLHTRLPEVGLTTT